MPRDAGGPEADPHRRTAPAAGAGGHAEHADDHADRAGLPRDRVISAGSRHDVEIGPAIDGRAPSWVRRVPRSAYDAGRLRDAAARWQAASDAGLPAPAVVGGDLDGPLGRAHLTVAWADGVPLGSIGDVEVVAGAAIDLLGRLRAADVSAFVALDDAPWGDLWADLEHRVRQLLAPNLSSDEAAECLAACRFAASTAADAPSGVVHGDLTVGNVLVDPVDGRLTAVLDWDGAVVGDPAVNAAGLLASLPVDVADAVRRRDTQVAAEERRHDAYLATWTWQHRLWQLDAAASSHWGSQGHL